MVRAFNLRDNEKIACDWAINKGSLYLSDISEIWDIDLRSDNRDQIKRKIKRLIALEILAPGQKGFKFVNKRNYPKEQLLPFFQKTLGDDKL